MLSVFLMNVAHLVLMYLLDATSAVQQGLQYALYLSSLNLYALILCTEKHIKSNLCPNL